MGSFTCLIYTKIWSHSKSNLFANFIRAAVIACVNFRADWFCEWVRRKQQQKRHGARTDDDAKSNCITNDRAQRAFGKASVGMSNLVRVLLVFHFICYSRFVFMQSDFPIIYFRWCISLQEMGLRRTGDSHPLSKITYCKWPTSPNVSCYFLGQILIQVHKTMQVYVKLGRRPRSQMTFPLSCLCCHKPIQSRRKTIFNGLSGSHS